MTAGPDCRKPPQAEDFTASGGEDGANNTDDSDSDESDGIPMTRMSADGHLPSGQTRRGPRAPDLGAEDFESTPPASQRAGDWQARLVCRAPPEDDKASEASASSRPDSATPLIDPPSTGRRWWLFGCAVQ
mmetsp:Transcript_102953/g.291599  ORF Transcript_102953/g.291599 Transcript_102953/m.291599 type:complete len:131 (+) Transcript_102953:20-412(+)